MKKPPLMDAEDFEPLPSEEKNNGEDTGEYLLTEDPMHNMDT